jgi:hypothetical protein
MLNKLVIGQSTPMTKILFSLATQSLLLIPGFSILVLNHASVASTPVTQSIDDVDPQEITVAVEGKKVCARHPKITKLLCTDLEQILQLKKGVAMIDIANSNDKDALMNVTNEESDAAIAMFGCDCATSINRLRHVRNTLS